MPPVQIARRPDGSFANPWGSAGELPGFGAALKWMAARPFTRPAHSISRHDFAARFPLAKNTFPTPRAAATDLVITWIGHSSFLIQIGGRNILTDPVWSDRASPFQWLGPRRWMPPAIPFATLPPIDAVVISHNHYDHLDDPTIRRIARLDPAPRWYAPLGVSAWLSQRGARDVREYDWWGQDQWADPRFPVPLTLTATPAQHFSGRGPARNHTLWCGMGHPRRRSRRLVRRRYRPPFQLRRDRCPLRPARRHSDAGRRLRSAMVHGTRARVARRRRRRIF